MPIRVAIVEDDAAVREGLGFLLTESPGVECVASCQTGEEALSVIPHCGADVVLMDVALPGISGIDCIRQLKALMPRLQIMMLTVFEDPDRIFRSLAAGASGYLVKKTPPTKLLQAIRDLHNGNSPMSGQIARRVIEAFQEPQIQADNLSARERQILDFLVRGQTYKEISVTLGIGIETVRTHIRRIYEKLHVSSKIEALLKVFPPRRLSEPPPDASNGLDWQV